MAVHAVNASKYNRSAPRMNFLELLDAAEKRDTLSLSRTSPSTSPSLLESGSMSPASSMSTDESESSASTTVTATGEKRRRRRKSSEAKNDKKVQKQREVAGKAVLLPIKSVDGKATYFLARRRTSDIAPSDYARALQEIIRENAW